MGLGPDATVVLMKFCISVGLSNVNVGLVFRDTNTLLLLMVTVPDCTNPWVLAEAAEVAVEDPAEGVEVGVETGVEVGVETGVGALHTEG